MADTQAALETGDIPQGYEEVPPDVPAGYESVAEPPKPQMGPTIFGIPTAAAARIGGVVTRVFNKAGEDAAKNFVSTFSSLADQDKAELVANGYGNYSGPGALLQHAADTFNSGVAIIKDGFFAGWSAVEGLGAGAESQIAREMGAPEDVAKSAEREGGFTTYAALQDVGAMHGMSGIDAARANMNAPGVWGDVYRMDQTDGPAGGGLTRVNLGRFPDGGAEAAQQAKVAATNLGLGDKTADLIHRTYLETGRPPAETLLDAQTDHGGVLSDLLAGKTPTAYTGAPRALTPEELAAAKPPEPPTAPAGATEPGKATGQPAAGTAPTGGQPAKAETVLPQVEQPEAGVSKVGADIQARAIEKGLIADGFDQTTAGYDKQTWNDQLERVATFLKDKSPEQVMALLRGDEPLPSGMNSRIFLGGAEKYAEKAPEIINDLTNSPLVTGTSTAAQITGAGRLYAGDSLVNYARELQDTLNKTAGKRAKAIQAEGQAATEGIFLPKQQARWESFLDRLKC